MAARRVADYAAHVAEDLYNCSLKRQTGVSLKHMMDFVPTQRNLLLSAQFLHKELPIRLAHRVLELENLPYGLTEKIPILQVRQWYIDSFRDLRSFPDIRNSQDEASFTNLLYQIKRRHADVISTMALGIRELKQDIGPRIGRDDVPEVHQFMDRFFMSRIGIRMLIGQHVAMHIPNQPPSYVGLISTKASPVEISRNAVEDAQVVCRRAYGDTPDVHIYGDPKFTFAYVPTHLHHMIFELVKNSLRAVLVRYMKTSSDPPPIRVIVADGLEDVTIKISDEGGGIPRSGISKIWSYLYSTADTPSVSGNSRDMPSAMAGYGFGLPISRLHARYFGGDLQVMSMEGYGTDAYLHLTRLGNVQEPLP
ncbi:hypothetical protein KP509_17G046100 [Ceratopteris richardii]|uniref:Protein-serine/threonine kinase n=2 Tax=Ceratopteris richardii TaxID=49495 RepID=A0A8T2SVG4_CERRI|nr:hypothetical protein KP509_17G046100 [Ceratopteris richardii]